MSKKRAHVEQKEDKEDQKGEGRSILYNGKLTTEGHQPGCSDPTVIVSSTFKGRASRET